MRNSKQPKPHTHTQTDRHNKAPFTFKQKQTCTRCESEHKRKLESTFQRKFSNFSCTYRKQNKQKKLTFLRNLPRAFVWQGDRRISKTNNHKQTLTEEKTQLSRRKKLQRQRKKMSNLDADDGVAVHGAKEDFFVFYSEFSLNFCNTKLFFFFPRKERKK